MVITMRIWTLLAIVVVAVSNNELNASPSRDVHDRRNLWTSQRVMHDDKMAAVVHDDRPGMAGGLLPVRLEDGGVGNGSPTGIEGRRVVVSATTVIEGGYGQGGYGEARRGVEGGEEEDEDHMMVAFLCNRPAMHLTQTEGWKSDELNDCLRHPADILNYCRKIYPTLTFSSIVRSRSTVLISNWCAMGSKTCNNRYAVKPYRCIRDAAKAIDTVTTTPPPPSEQLHLSKSKQLVSQQQRGRTHSTHHPFHDTPSENHVQTTPTSMITHTASSHVVPIHTTMMSTHVRPIHTTTTDDMLLYTPSIGTGDSGEYMRYLNQEVPTGFETGNDDVMAVDEHKLMEHQMTEHQMTEHQMYERAKADLEERHREKVSKMLSEWAIARRRVQEIKETDPKGAEKYNKEITARFQKAYEALEREGGKRRAQLSRVHHERVQAELDRKRRGAHDNYLDAISERRPEASRILKALTHYVKLEHKEQMHAIKNFRHALAAQAEAAAEGQYDREQGEGGQDGGRMRVDEEEVGEEDSKGRVEEGEEVEAARSDAAVRLTASKDRVREALEVLERVPELEQKIRPHIEKTIDEYPSLSDELRELSRQSETRKDRSDKSSPHQMEFLYGLPPESIESDSDKDHQDPTTASPSSSSSSASSSTTAPSSTTTPPPRRKPGHHHQSVLKTTTRPAHQSTLDNRNNHDGDVVKHVVQDDNATSLDGRQSVPRVNLMSWPAAPPAAAHVAHVEQSHIIINENKIRKAGKEALGGGGRHKSSGRIGGPDLHVAAPLGVAIGGATVFAVLVIGVALLRQRNSASTVHCPRDDVTDQALTVDPACYQPAGDPRPAVMNGYENPTHQFLADKA